MIVYRVEHKSKGFGPYVTRCMDSTHYYLSGELCNKHNCSVKHPICSWIRDNQFCGFSSINQAKNWFSGFLKKLHKHDYVLSVYDCPDSFVESRDEKQVVFERSKSKLIKKLSVLCRKS